MPAGGRHRVSSAISDSGRLAGRNRDAAAPERVQAPCRPRRLAAIITFATLVGMTAMTRVRCVERCAIAASRTTAAKSGRCRSCRASLAAIGGRSRRRSAPLSPGSCRACSCRSPCFPSPRCRNRRRWAISGISQSQKSGGGAVGKRPGQNFGSPYPPGVGRSRSFREPGPKRPSRTTPPRQTPLRQTTHQGPFSTVVSPAAI